MNPDGKVTQLYIAILHENTCDNMRQLVFKIYNTDLLPILLIQSIKFSSIKII